MKQAGEVTFADVMMEPSGRSKGCGVVEYATQEAAQAAIETLNDTDLLGRKIFIREDRENVGTGFTGNMGRGGGMMMRGGMAPMMGMPMGMPMGIPMGFRGRGRGIGRVGGRGMGRGMGRDPANDPPQGRQVHIGNLPFQVAWQDIKDICKLHGEVERADVAVDEAGRSRGYALVLFATPGGARRAIQRMNGQECGGRILTCKLDEYA